MANAKLMSNVVMQATPARRRHRSEALAYRLVFSICFVVFIFALATARVVPRPWRWMSATCNANSIWSAAKEAAHSCTAIAFQG